MTATATRKVAKHFKRGDKVRVPLGASRHKATVVEQRHGRVRVAIDVDGMDRKIRTSYRPDQVEPA